ncbi:PepSY-associated TM helix domain-containing protein [Pseudonocardia sp.]|uniref:PepSY-associated TM helix domain-containing protein n=1 Tax=Pseudonocardia sp. TaxID=60912 RepID=UPI003D0CE35C
MVSTADMPRTSRAPQPRAPGGAAGGPVLRPLARRVHFLAGILIAPFVLLLCLTGLVYVFSPQIHDNLYAQQLYVHHVGDAPRPVAEQVAAAMDAHPEAELRSVVPPPEPGRTTRVNLSVPSLSERGEARTVYVDPYTNYISGELTTMNDRLPANVWLRDLHSNLHLGEIGRLYAQVAASWLPAVVLGGVLLWVAKQGRRRRSARELLVPVPRGKGTQSRLRSVHGPLGLWLAFGLVGMSVTGLMMGGLPNARVPQLALAPVAVPSDVRTLTVDEMLDVARAEGLDGELRVTPPAVPDRPAVVAETAPGRDGIAVDPYTGAVTERIGWDDYAFLAKVRTLGTEAHTGALFGVANQILLALLAVATIVLIVVGYLMWWAKRSPYQGPLPPAPPPAVRELTHPVRAAILLVVAVLGYLVPVFGVSLVAFVVADLAINAVRRRRARRPVRQRVTLGQREPSRTR